jgi:membrane-bound lytic murein transglycosylase D
MMIYYGGNTLRKTDWLGSINSMPGRALHILSMLGLFSLCAFSPQGNLHAEGVSHIKTHFPIMEMRLATARFELGQSGDLPETSIALDPLLEQINPDDLAQAQALVKRNFLKKWNVIAKRSRHVRYRMLESLKQMGVPISLQVIPIVESSYDPYALSHAGALGLWQLMPATARELGLRPSKEQNGRRSVEHSTQAAMQYMSMLYDRFNSWPLAIAAYNMGPNGLARRLKKSPWKNADGLDNMPIPRSTRIYVQHVIGLVSLLHMGEFSLPEPTATRALLLEPPVDIIGLAQTAGMGKEEMFRLNPSLNQAQYLKRAVSIHVPVSKYDQLKAKMALAGPKYLYLTVRKGDSLWRISRATSTSIGNLRRLNPGVRTRLSIGQKLKVPANKAARASTNPNPLLSSSRRIRYKVRSGDSLWRIAHRFGTSVKAIARSNQLSTKSLIRPGDTLWILARL